MPPALGRLKTRPEFLRVAGARRKCVKPGLILQVSRRPAPNHDGGNGGAGEPDVRVGFTASRKVGSAVDRNRARRRLRAVVRAVMPEHARPGHDYVLIARRATLTRPFAALVRDLEAALEEAGGDRGASRGAPKSDAASRAKGA